MKLTILFGSYKISLENPPNTYSNTVKVFPDENLPYGSIPNQKIINLKVEVILFCFINIKIM